MSEDLIETTEFVKPIQVKQEFKLILVASSSETKDVINADNKQKQLKDQQRNQQKNQQKNMRHQFKNR